MGDEVVGKSSAVRMLGRMAETFHDVTYYSPEAIEFTKDGYRGWWHAYFAYRPAPMGAVEAATVAAAFYNFAPRMVAKAVPGVWDIRSPAEVTALRQEMVIRSLRRHFPQPGPDVAEAARLIRAVDGCSLSGRPVYAAYAGLEWPNEDLAALWHGCTLLREHRGDSHHLALAAAQVDGVACHVLMAGMGHGNRPTINAIRGWTDDEWDRAAAELGERGWLAPDGSLTDDGQQARTDIELHTDRLASEPLTRIGEDGVERLLSHLEPLVTQLSASGEIPGGWPPEHLSKPADPLP